MYSPWDIIYNKSLIHCLSIQYPFLKKVLCKVGCGISFKFNISVYGIPNKLQVNERNSQGGTIFFLNN